MHNGAQWGANAYNVCIAEYPVILSYTVHPELLWTPAMNKPGLIHPGFVHR
jgi:hypothetical protein